VTAPPILYNVGSGTGFLAQASGSLGWVTGSFPTVTDVTSEYDNSGPRGSQVANSFSFQLNTNRFQNSTTQRLCQNSTNLNCQGWQQFVFANGDGFTGISIQYWLLNYVPTANNPCPSGWNAAPKPPDTPLHCYQNSPFATVSRESAADALANLALGGGYSPTDAKDKVFLSSRGSLIASAMNSDT